MKAFILSAVILVVAVTGVVVNACYATSLYGEFEELLLNFPDSVQSKSGTDAMEYAKHLFDSHNNYFYLTLPKTDIAEFTENFNEIYSYYKTSDNALYLDALERTKITVSLLKYNEAVIFREIFGS